MSQHWDLIIIGAGLAGSSLAAYASERGLRTLLIEAATVGGAGATAHSRGIVRVYDPVPELLHYNLGGVAEWRRLNARWPGVFTSCGVLYLLAAEHVTAARAAVQTAQVPDYPIHFIRPEQALQLLPQLNPQLLHSGAQALWEPLGGHVDPRRAAALLAEHSRQQGAEILEGSTVSAVLDTPQGAAVYVGDAVLHGRVAVVAGGAASTDLISASGIFSRTIPLSCFASQAAQIPTACVIDEVSGSYLRPLSRELGFIGGATQFDAATPAALQWDTPAANVQHQQLSQHLMASPVQLVDARNGFDGYTTDFVPKIRFTDDSAIALFSGFSGRGAKYIPHAARLFAAQLSERLR